MVYVFLIELIPKVFGILKEGTIMQKGSSSLYALNFKTDYYVAYYFFASCFFPPSIPEK